MRLDEFYPSKGYFDSRCQDFTFYPGEEDKVDELSEKLNKLLQNQGFIRVTDFCVLYSVTFENYDSLSIHQSAAFYGWTRNPISGKEYNGYDVKMRLLISNDVYLIKESKAW